ncbi:MAG TPA: non-homologous end-joining DNA ligase [Actinomycetales bacterium]|nr:non-homologous end-joining DNA ligase [Actinomycetales bacterium]
MSAREAKSTINVDDVQIPVRNLDKVLYPESGTTKGEVIDYLLAIAPVLLPQLAQRPVTRIRFPDGLEGQRFFEKNAPRGTPDWVRTQILPASPGAKDPGKDVTYPFIDNEAGLVWLGGLAALELHTPQWRAGPRGGVKHPDRLVIDLDPGKGMGLADCAAVAHIVAERLEREDLQTFPVTSGSKGMQLYAPLHGGLVNTRDYARKLAHELADANPELITADMSKEERVGKVLLDWSQNHRAKTTITPYSLRARTHIAVAAPRTWDEIGPELTQLTPCEVLQRVTDLGDLAPPTGAD